MKMWSAYETHWNEFTKMCAVPESLRADQVPLPINNKTLIFHMRAVVEREAATKPKNNKDLWVKAQKEALRRYHPDKFLQNFAKCLRTEEDKIAILRQINEVCQTLNTRF